MKNLTNLTKITSIYALVFLISSCASIKQPGQTSYNNEDASATADLDTNTIEELIHLTDLDEETPQEVVVTEKVKPKKSTYKYQIPRVINEQVKKWFNYFTVNETGRAWYQRALTRSEAYEAHMKNILISSEVPEELFYLALIESAFVQRAHSHAGAKGIWQFMKGTAKLYGLHVSRRHDERLDPYKATAAAAAYLKDLYNIYGSWYLAIASYNAGEGRIRSAIIKHKERNFWELVAKNALPMETINYVPKYIAASIIGENPQKFGFVYNGPSKGAPEVSEDIERLIASNHYRRGAKPPSVVRPSTSLVDTTPTTVHRVRRGENLSTIARKYRTNVASIKGCNPRLRGNTIYAGQNLSINCGGGTSVVASAPKQTRVASSAQTSSVSAASTTPTYYRIKWGDNLEGISKRYGLSIEQIKECNPTVKRHKILAGQRLRLSCPDQNVQIAQAKPGQSKFTHTVRRGESLWSISQKYNVSVSDLVKWNNLKKRNKIFAGRKLMILNKTDDNTKNG
jgi:membrane-bound lytic murein transglycosylase D